MSISYMYVELMALSPTDDGKGSDKSHNESVANRFLTVFVTVQTSGAKLFSSHAGTPHDRPLPDTTPDLYEIQKAQEPLLELLKPVCIMSFFCNDCGSLALTYCSSSTRLLAPTTR